MIELDHVSKQFAGTRKVTALRDISLSVPRGEMIAIIGPSGSGKSTLLNLMGALDRPTTGVVRIDGAALGGLQDDGLTRVRRDKIGFIFQFFNLLPTLSCLENVGLPLHLRGWPRARVHERATELLRLVQLDHRLPHLPEELSGGERQRVAIARALSIYPPILLADEPTGNLDSRTGAEILTLIDDLHIRLGATIVIVTHDMQVAARCGRTIALRDGQIEEDVRPMMLLGLISWPYFRKHVLRMVLTTAGIVLGVAVFVGMHTANQSVLYAFNRTVDRIAGKTELQVTAGESGFDEAVLETVQGAAAVRIAVPVIEAFVDTQIAGEGALLVLGTDMTGDRSLRDYDLEEGDDAVIDDPLVFLAQPDSIILTREFAAKNHFGVNSQVTLGTVLGPKQFTVRGVMKSSGLSSAFGGNLAIMDIYAAQRMFGRGRSFDRIDLATRPDTTIAQAQAELRQLLGPGFQVDAPSGRGQQFEAMTAAYSMMVSISSLFALFIGMFIIYNAFAIAVTERRAEIGILRALGATRGQVRRLFLLESAVTGLVGSLVGLGFGLLIARAIAASIGDFIGDVYGVAQHAGDIAMSPALLVLALVIGVATSMIAAVIPARQAAHVDPVHALQKGRYQVLSAGESRIRGLIAALLGSLSVGCLLLSDSRIGFYLGYVMAIAVALLIGPVLSLALSRALRPLLKWLRPVEGTLAADSLIQAPRRTSASVAALMLSLALVTAFAGMARASYHSIIDWMESALNPDLFVTPSQDVVIRTLRFPATMAGELTAIPGIERVQPVRNTRIVFRDIPVMIVATEIESIAETAPLPPIAGDAQDMYRRTAAGEGLMVSDNFAQLQRLSLGDTVEIPAPHGVIRLPIVGIVIDFSDQQGAILMDRSVFEHYWHDDSVNVFRVYLSAGAQVPEVKRRILERYADERQVFVLTNGELKAYILRITDQWFGLTSVQIAVAVLVAILGIVNTLTVSITDRRRELGVLKAVGGLRGQIRRTIWMEAVSIGTLGLVLGFALGAVNLYYILQIVQRDIAGMRLDYVFPVTVALALVPTILAAAFVAALWPAESAVRGSLVEALEYE